VLAYMEHLGKIRVGMEKAHVHRTQIRRRMNQIEREGMYPAVPREQWQARNGGEARYLYMLFRMNPDGSYQGPDGKRKVYVGADPRKQAEARRLAANRRRWEELNTVLQNLNAWLTRLTRELAEMATWIDHYPKVLGGEVSE